MYFRSTRSAVNLSTFETIGGGGRVFCSNNDGNLTCTIATNSMFADFPGTSYVRNIIIANEVQYYIIASSPSTVFRFSLCCSSPRPKCRDRTTTINQSSDMILLCYRCVYGLFYSRRTTFSSRGFSNSRTWCAAFRSDACPYPNHSADYCIVTTVRFLPYPSTWRAYNKRDVRPEVLNLF